jgi:hypothetical protein
MEKLKRPPHQKIERNRKSTTLTEIEFSIFEPTEPEDASRHEFIFYILN